MTAPVLLSCQYVDHAPTTTVYLIFDRNVSASNVTLGWTVTKTPGGVFVPSVITISNTAVVMTLATTIGTAGLTVAYNAGVGTVVQAVAPNTPVASFSATAVAPSQAVIAQAGNPVNDAVTVFFDQPVAATAGDLVAGFTINVDGQPLDLSAAVGLLNAAQTELVIDTGVNLAYNAVVDVIYSSLTGELVTYPNGVVPSFSFLNVRNLSTDGLPNSVYPLSYVIAGPVQMCQKVATGVLEVSLNPIDIELVGRYGPVVILTGGTFGVTLANPTGIAILGAQVTLTDGIQILQPFTSGVDVSFASAAALDWQTAITARISIALGQIRAIDQLVTLGTRTISQV